MNNIHFHSSKEYNDVYKIVVMLLLIECPVQKINPMKMRLVKVINCLNNAYISDLSDEKNIQVILQYFRTFLILPVFKTQIFVTCQIAFTRSF